MQTFTGRTAVVTGGASGIGLALANRFATEGMNVVLADVDAESLHTAVEQLRQSGAKAIGVPTDVASAESVQALADAAVQAFGAVHVLCNNAGVGSPPGPIWNRTLDDWRWVLDVNLWGVIHGIRTFVPLLLQLPADEEAHIVNTASMAGLLTMANLGVYTITKHAVVALSETLLTDLGGPGSRIGVSVLCPAFVRTRIMDSERNRPAELASQRGDISADTLEWAVQFQSMVAAGIDPAQVADKVIEGIRNRSLYIFTHPEFEPPVRQRFGAILDAYSKSNQ